jgi:thiol-disulfide isomerase/thioredoxin
MSSLSFGPIGYGFLLSVVSVSTLAAQPPASVHIYGMLKHFTNGADIVDASEMEYLLPPAAAGLITPDTSGIFDKVFPLKEPGYYQIGRNVLYLTPGDDLRVVVDYNDPEKGSFTGPGSAPNNYLRTTPFPHAGSFLDGGRYLRKTPDSTLKIILAKAYARKQVLDTLGGVSAVFRQMEYGRIRADIVNSCRDVEGYSSFLVKNKDSARIYQTVFKKISASVLQQYDAKTYDASLLPLSVYRELVQARFEEAKATASAKGVDPVVRDWVKASELADGIRMVSDKARLAEMKPFVDSIGTDKYREALRRLLQRALAFGKGDEATDFQVTDVSGNEVRLSALKGKVIYVDIWATWCGPCMAEMPHFEQLKEKYKDNPSVAFVSLSIDDDKAGWQKSVQRRGATGYQWLISRNRLSAYNIVSIPRVLLIDKDFRIVELNAELPSDPSAAKVIDGLL